MNENLSNPLTANVTDPLLKLALGNPKEGINPDEYGPLHRLISSMCIDDAAAAENMLVILRALQLASGWRFDLLIDEAVRYTYRFTQHGRESLMGCVKQLEEGGQS